ESRGVLTSNRSKVVSRRKVKVNESNGTVMPETESDRNARKGMIDSVEVEFNNKRHGDEKLGGEGFKTKHSRVT
ncbi:hypothetical protein KI387_020995, partial [Taxus chinensis]